MSTDLQTHTVESRVKIVTALIRQSVEAWLDIAKHVQSAKIELCPTDFAKFLELTSLTKAISDKLLRIAQCQRLYESEFQKHCNRLDGWTNLYEVSKLNNPEIDRFVEHIDQDAGVAVTSELIRSFSSSKSSKSPSSSSYQLANIVMLHDELQRLDLVEFDRLKTLIDQIHRMIDAAAPALSIKIFDDTITALEARLSLEPTEAELSESQTDELNSAIVSTISVNNISNNHNI